jgi:hypothetical protein
VDEVQGEILDMEIHRLVQEYTSHSLKIFKESPSMLIEADSYRPDTHYQISLQTNESHSLSALKDRLDQILMKKADDP